MRKHFFTTQTFSHNTIFHTTQHHHSLTLNSRTNSPTLHQHKFANAHPPPANTITHDTMIRTPTPSRWSTPNKFHSTTLQPNSHPTLTRRVPVGFTLRYIQPDYSVAHTYTPAVRTTVTQVHS